MVEHEAEAAALARFTVYDDGATEQPGEALAQIQTEASALATTALANVREGIEQLFLVRGADADTRVHHADGRNCAILLAPGIRFDDHAARLGELDGVVGEVD